MFSSLILSCAPPTDKYINAQTHLQLGLTYIQLGYYDLAEKQLKKAIVFKKNYFDAERTLAYLYQMIGRSEKAEYLYHKLIKKYPFSDALYNNYGIFLCQLKKYKKAILAFHQALKYNPNNKPIQHNLKLCKQKKLGIFQQPLLSRKSLPSNTG